MTDTDLLTPREQLIAKVLDQIVTDVDSGDLTAIFELLSNIPDRELEAYLPQGV